MTEGSLSFSYQFAASEREALTVERNRLLLEAARLVDLKARPLAPQTGTAAPTPEGEVIRALADDAAELASFPDIYRVTDKEFLNRGLKEVPARYQELARDFRFYWLRMGVGLRRRVGSSFRKLELQVRFHGKDAPTHLQPKAYLIYPEQRYQTLFEGKASASIGFDANYDLEASVKDLEVDLAGAAGRLGAGAASKGSGSVSLSVGPFHGQWRRATVEHSGVGLDWVFWRISATEFIGQEQGPGFIVVLQVPHATRTVTATADLRAYRRFHLMAPALQQVIEQLPDFLGQFFREGAPVPDHADWDLTPMLV